MWKFNSVKFWAATNFFTKNIYFASYGDNEIRILWLSGEPKENVEDDLKIVFHIITGIHKNTCRLYWCWFLAVRAIPVRRSSLYSQKRTWPTSNIYADLELDDKLSCLTANKYREPYRKQQKVVRIIDNEAGTLHEECWVFFFMLDVGKC